MPPKTSKLSTRTGYKAKTKDVSNVYFNHDYAIKIIKAKRVNPQQLIFLERFLKKSKQDDQGRWFSPTFYDRDTYGREISRIGPDDKHVLRWTGSSMDSNIRNLLYGNLYSDVDFVNCHPSITLCIFQYFNLPRDLTQEYVLHRDQVLQDLIYRAGGDVYLNRDEAKELLLRIFYGGKVSSWCKDHNTLLDNFKEYQNLKEEVRTNIISILNNRHLRFLDICPHDILQWAEGRRDSEGDSRDKYSKAWAYFCQELERRCLDVLIRNAISNGFIIGSKIYDGVHLSRPGFSTRIDQCTELIQGFIPNWETAIQDHLGIRVRITVKEMKQDLTLLESGPDSTPSVVVDDAYAAEVFYKLLGNKVKKHYGDIYVFDNSTGLWDRNDSKDQALFHAARSYREQLMVEEIVIDNEGKEHRKVHNYGGISSKTRAMLCYFHKLVPDTQFLHNLDSSKGKLLWSNGIYDFATDTFTLGFDPDIIFINRINRKYPEDRVSNEKVEFIKNLLFVKPFDTMKDDREKGLLAGKYLLESVARSIYGDYYCKKFNICIGDANSGKGLLVDALKACFNTYVADYNGNNLLYNQQSCDEAKKNAWIADLLGKRIAFCNEVKFGTSVSSGGLPPRIDANLLKKLASGGDTIDVRKNYQDQTEMVNRCLMFFMCNDVPDIYPANDSGIKERVRCVSYFRQFKDLNECIFKNTVIDETSGISLKDESVKERVKNDVDLQNALWFLIKDTVRSILQENGTTKIKEPETVLTLTKDYVSGGDVEFKDIFKKYFKVTNVKTDCVTSECVSRKINEDMTMSSIRLSKEIFKLLPSGWSDDEKKKKKKVNGKGSLWCYFGIQEHLKDSDDLSSTDTEEA